MNLSIKRQFNVEMNNCSTIYAICASILKINRHIKIVVKYSYISCTFGCKIESRTVEKRRVEVG